MVHTLSKSSPESSEASANPEKVVEAIRTLLAALSPKDRERALREIATTARPDGAPRPGDVLGVVIKLFERQPSATVQDIRRHVAATGLNATPKEIYNTLAYLTRKNRLTRVGYGRYLFEGMLMETADDLGGDPVRYED